MIRLVYVTPYAPSLRTGGGRHCYSNLRALCEAPGTSVAYVGPPIVERLDGLERVSILVARAYRLRDKVVAAASRAASSLLGLYRELDGRGPGRFDVAFLETTRVGFAVSRDPLAPRTVCCVHNVEADFMRGRRGLSGIAARNVRRSEAEMLRRCDHLLVMHEHDLERLKSVYAMPDLVRRVELHPVCAFESLPPSDYATRKRRIVIPGSLDQSYNEDGIRAFVRDCWPSLRHLNVELVVAGRNPRPSLRSAVVSAGGALIENPPSMPEIVRDARVVLVPDQGGAGMKLRVAEALSLGVPVVGTREGLLGYAEPNEFGRTASDISGMTGAVRSILEDEVLGAQLASRALEVWRTRYSFEAFSARLRGLLGSWSGS